MGVRLVHLSVESARPEAVGHRGRDAGTAGRGSRSGEPRGKRAQAMPPTTRRSPTATMASSTAGQQGPVGGRGRRPLRAGNPQGYAGTLPMF